MSQQEPPTVNRIDETSLHAYVDGQLGPAECAEVQAWLQAHPEDAARVQAWQQQRGDLQALQAGMLDQPLPPHLLRALEAPKPPAAANAASYAWQALAAGLLLSLGLGGGWLAHGWWGVPASALDGQAARQAPRLDAPAFVRDAAIAHAVFMPEKRHPVEVGAEQQDHLLQWLSKRLGHTLRVPDLGSQGFRLVGGRLLPAGQAAPGAGLSRAQFMYENPAGERLTLYVSVVDAARAAPAEFALSEHRDGPQTTRSYYWIDGQLGYALSGQLPAGLLARAGAQVYAQLQP